MLRILLSIATAATMALAPCASAAQTPPPVRAKAEAPAPGQYKDFRVAIYVVVNATRRLADRATFDREFERAMRQVKFDKVYLEVYRDRNFATDAEIRAVKRHFTEKGIEVAAGVTLAAGGSDGQFGTFDYELPADRAECERAVRLAARHFDEVILDDFFFYTSKSEADIAAKGSRSWTRYRLETMRAASRDLVIAPAKAENPRVRVIIKYPNWYEHFQGLGYDLEQQPRMFDAIYTGTETRDPEITDQLLQQYESYLIFRYFENIRPGANLGGWVDTFSTRYVDRYAEQLWDTLFAKAPEITLFNWAPMAEAKPVAPGDRQAWSGLPTSFQWEAMRASYRAAGPGDPGPGWGRAAGYSLEQVDGIIGKLGRPIGMRAYKPFHSTGEDFLHNYLGNVGLPIDLRPDFLPGADTVLLTESAKFDPEIVAKMRAQLNAGGRVVITSGLLRSLQGKGIEDIVEVEHTGRVAAIRQFFDGYGAGNGTSLNDPGRDNPTVLFPEIRFLTNDSWPIVRGVANAKGFPILLMNRYAKGVIYVLAVPENPGDLYNLPVGLLSRIKAYLHDDAPVRVEAEPLVSVFAYDNDTLVLRSYRHAPATVKVSVRGKAAALRDLKTGRKFEPVGAEAPAQGAAGRSGDRTWFTATLQPHSFQALSIERRSSASR